LQLLASFGLPFAVSSFEQEFLFTLAIVLSSSFILALFSLGLV